MQLLDHTRRLGVLMPGMGAVATTFMAGVLSARHQPERLFGSITAMGKLDDGQPMRQGLEMPSPGDLVFGGWDIYEGHALDAAQRAGVLEERDLAPVAGELEAIRPMEAVFDPRYVKNLEPARYKRGTRRALAQALLDDIERFMQQHELDRVVGIWCGSTERLPPASPSHASLEAFERGLDEDDPAITPSMLYAYAFLSLGLPYANGSPNEALDVPALLELAELRAAPVAGKDFKTGQTLIKTVIAPALAARFLGLRGWYSTNILGNLDGAVLDDPGSFEAKAKTKLSVLEGILDAASQPELYGEMHHKVRIDYYPPRGDNKEGWDNLDIFGWMGYPMQIKINFLCRDSILAAPLVLDLALLLDAAKRTSRRGVQDWLSFFFKSPQPVRAGARVEHDLFHQRDALMRAIASMHEELHAAHDDLAPTLPLPASSLA